MAARAGGLTEEQRLPRRRRAVRRDRCVGARCRRRQAAEVGDELPRLLVGERGERRHLTAGHAGPDRMEQIAIVVAARKRTRVERGPAVAARGRAVTRLTRLVVEAMTGGGGVWPPG